MIEARVRDFRGIERVDLDVAPIALVGGRNGSGKTSLAQAIGAVLCGDALPVDGVNKSSAGVMVRAGRDAAAATVQSESGTARIDWPGCTRRTEKEPPEASAFAAGLRSVVDRDVDRVAVLSAYLHSAPTRDDLAAELVDHPGLAGPEVLDAVWDLIQVRGGWDGAQQARRDKGAELKGRWRQITGQNYGSRIASMFRPDLDDERRSTPDLVAEVETARQAFEAAVASSAVSGENRKRLEDVAATADACAATLQTAEAAADAADQALQAALDARGACLPAVAGGGELPCPHCGGLIMVVRRNLVETVLEAASTDRVDDAELKKRRLAIAGADGDVSRCRGELGTAQRHRADADHALQAALDARRALETMPAAQGGADLEGARAALGAAERRLNEVRTKRQADDIAGRITDNEVLLSILAPDGLRARKLARILDTFNAGPLAALTTSAGWGAVTIDPDLEIAYRGRHYALCSASEQFRVRVILQVAMAQLDRSAMVIIDGADILDGPARQQLFGLLVDASMPAIVTMTMPAKDRVPELDEVGLGRSYWLDGGNIEPITPAARAA
jgi:hypothetical protein